MGKQYHVAIVGATGAVGAAMVDILAARKFPAGRLSLFATARTAGRTVPWNGADLIVQDVTTTGFAGVDIVLFAGGEIASASYIPLAVAAGAVCIDNSSHYRMDPAVPLVVPEVNPEALRAHRGIIANPNCSTIQMVMALKPLHDAAGVERVVVSTYQSVSGTGKDAMEELNLQVAAAAGGPPAAPAVYPYPIAFNVLPEIGGLLPSGYTQEEEKMMHETRKILEDPSMKISATTVRVPVLVGHSETVNITTREKVTAARARELLAKFPGVRVLDDLASHQYPMPLTAAGTDEVWVGRIREDASQERGLDLWVVADNLRKGAALNAVQIAETMIKMGCL